MKVCGRRQWNSQEYSMDSYGCQRSTMRDGKIKISRKKYNQSVNTLTMNELFVFLVSYQKF